MKWLERILGVEAAAPLTAPPDAWAQELRVAGRRNVHSNRSASTGFKRAALRAG